MSRRRRQLPNEDHDSEHEPDDVYSDVGEQDNLASEIVSAVVVAENNSEENRSDHDPHAVEKMSLEAEAEDKNPSSSSTTSPNDIKSSRNEKPVKKDPMYVPRGQFYLHDDRDAHVSANPSKKYNKPKSEPFVPRRRSSDESSFVPERPGNKSYLSR
jgi:hypothetical protein